MSGRTFRLPSSILEIVDEETPASAASQVITEEAQKGLLLMFLSAGIRAELLASPQDWLQSLKELAEPGCTSAAP